MALSSSSIRVAVLEETGERVLVEGKFTHKVNTEGSVWSLEPGKCVLVSAGPVLQGGRAGRRRDGRCTRSAGRASALPLGTPVSCGNVAVRGTGRRFGVSLL